jgi:hypothetical protein
MMVESVDTTDLNMIEPMPGNWCWDALKFGETSAHAWQRRAKRVGLTAGMKV